MKREDVINSYEELLKVKSLDYSKLDLLSKVGYNNKMQSLSTFKGPKIHTNFRQFTMIPDKVLKYIQTIIDGNVVINEIDDKCIEVQYVFDNRTFLVDTVLLKILEK